MQSVAARLKSHTANMAHEPVLQRDKHVRYWQRCHKTYLPSVYTSNDSTRVTFAYFIISALDVLHVPLSAHDGTAIRRWILGLQHPDGGFCGSPAHMPAGQQPGSINGSANLAATYFALLLLGAAAATDDEARAAFACVRRKKLLRWLRTLQREDGSFGQLVWDGKAMGGHDVRHSYFASCVRWMLRDAADQEDINLDTMVAYIRQGQTYDGGLAEASDHESHAGYAYCGVAALYMLHRPCNERRDALKRGVAHDESLISFLIHRPFDYQAKEEEADEVGENYIEAKLGQLGLCQASRHPTHIGYNGRCNKKADTCYCWWVAATLKMLGSLGLVDADSSRRYILDITQHRIGGFAKAVGRPPDIYHSYLGLAALALLDHKELKPFDAGLCCSLDMARKIALAREGADGARETSFDEDGFWQVAAQAYKE
ncbi:hypothetical protein CDD82_2830 [Ophiocordyceps australis]|uniref:Prenyltransferase alpha-alpha toroid domain-containing protein n=1 Tax=Ophiocordyceps australis TaxID=1399860 RepID=A0A2C5ZG10_9HYPO|nr:hypothetical protein CDD82_2830 [Ophiocordyceps australis]